MTKEEIAADRAIIEAATPGPWRRGDGTESAEWLVLAGGRPVASTPYKTIATDGAFIAAARTRWPIALDRIEELERDIGLAEATITGFVNEEDRLRAALAESDAQVSALSRQNEGHADEMADAFRQIARLTAALAAMTAARNTLAEIAESYQHVASALCGPCSRAIAFGPIEEIDELRAVGKESK